MWRMHGIKRKEPRFDLTDELTIQVDCNVVDNKISDMKLAKAIDP